MTPVPAARGRPDWAVVAAILPALGLSVFLVVLVHEALGHGLVAWLSGGRVLRLQVGIFHGQIWFEGVPPGGWQRAVGLGGIAVTFVLGLACLGLARLARARPLAEVLFRMLGAVSLASALGYLGLGSLLGKGDPLAIEWPGGDVGRAATFGPIGLLGAGAILLGQHRRLMVALGAPAGVRRRDRFRFGVLCWVPPLAILAGIEIVLSCWLGVRQREWLWVKLAAIPLAGMGLPAADVLLPGARPGGAPGHPFGFRAVLVLGAAHALALAILADGLYGGWDF